MKRNYKDEITSDSAAPPHTNNIAFIHQDDQFFSMLTVQETLRLAASLRLQQSNLNQTVLYARVEEVIQAMALQHVSSSFIGDTAKRGISGGERKRLAVASELLGSPRILLADEPTSGLDSFQAYSIMSHLSSLAKEKDMCIVCAIHQPRSTIWSLFDDILLLAEGRVAYMGPRGDVIPYF